MNSLVAAALACWIKGSGDCNLIQKNFEPDFQQEVVVERKVLDVPFTSQAPEKIWVEPWENACEETSVLMVDYFYRGVRDFSVEEVKSDILHILAVKNYAFGESLDESLALVDSLVNEVSLSWDGVVVNNPSLEDILKELDAERPVIAPVFARELKNPYYTGLGPDYHMLVLKGYDLGSREFIVNDPGTQFGADLRFGFDVMMEAIHDLDVEEYDKGMKRVMFTYIK